MNRENQINVLMDLGADSSTALQQSERLEQIETKIAYLEHANAQLSEVVLLQERDIEALRTQLSALRSRLDAGKGAESPWTAEDERPPHY
jgi:SlyX protein